MNNIVTTDTNTEVVIVTAPGPSGPIGPKGIQGPPGTISGNTGVNSTGSSFFSGSVTVIGTLTVTGSNTFINIGPARFTGSVDVSGSLSAITSSAQYFSGSGAGLTNIPASGITGLNLSRIATGSISASVNVGSTAFTLSNTGTNLFTISSGGLGTFAQGLTVNGSTTTLNQGLTVNGSTATLNNGLIVANGATLNGGTTVGTSLNVNGTATVSNLTVNAGGVTTLQGTATLNGAPILTSATVSTNRITDSNISASVSSTGKAFNVSNGATSLMSVDQNGAISGSGLHVSGSGNTIISSPSIALVGTATLNGQPITTAGDLTLNQIKSGAVTASVSTGADAFTLENAGSTLMTVSSSGYVSASGFIGDGSQLSNVGIIYNSGSNPLINSIEIADFDTNVAVTFVDGNLKFVFGTPVVPSAPSIAFSGFDTNRFNLQTDNYSVNASWVVGGYSLVRASMVDLSTGAEVASTTSGTSLSFNTTTSGSQSYRIAVTASSPLDGSINIQTRNTTGGTLSKVSPTDPIITPSADVQLGTTSGIEEGATGSISFTTAYGTDNGWERVSLVSSSASPIAVTATNTPSVTLTANYQSPAGTNSPTATTSRGASLSYSRIRSLRYGAAPGNSGFSLAQLQDLAFWDTTLGGTIGTIAKGTVSPSGQTITINTVDTVGGSYLYIIYSSSVGNITKITQGGFDVTGNFQQLSNVDNYKIYVSTGKQFGNATLTITV